MHLKPFATAFAQTPPPNLQQQKEKFIIERSILLSWNDTKMEVCGNRNAPVMHYSLWIKV
jgi:hypothetical protein